MTRELKQEYLQRLDGVVIQRSQNKHSNPVWGASGFGFWEYSGDSRFPLILFFINDDGLLMVHDPDLLHILRKVGPTSENIFLVELMREVGAEIKRVRIQWENEDFQKFLDNNIIMQLLHMS